MPTIDTTADNDGSHKSQESSRCCDPCDPVSGPPLLPLFHFLFLFEPRRTGVWSVFPLAELNASAADLHRTHSPHDTICHRRVSRPLAISNSTRPRRVELSSVHTTRSASADTLGLLLSFQPAEWGTQSQPPEIELAKTLSSRSSSMHRRRTSCL